MSTPASTNTVPVPPTSPIPTSPIPTSHDLGGPAQIPLPAVLGLLVTTALVVLAQLYASIPLAQPMGAEFGSARITVALAVSFSTCYAFGFLLYGPLSDHFGRRAVLVPGLAVLALLTAALGFVGSSTTLAVLRALQGTAAATFGPTVLAYLGESLNGQRRARAIAAMSVAFLSAGILGQVTAAAICTAWGWRWMFRLSSIVLLLLAAAVGLTLREPDVLRPVPAGSPLRQPCPVRGPTAFPSPGSRPPLVLGGFVASARSSARS